MTENKAVPSAEGTLRALKNVAACVALAAKASGRPAREWHARLSSDDPSTALRAAGDLRRAAARNEDTPERRTAKRALAGAYVSPMGETGTLLFEEYSHGPCRHQVRGHVGREPRPHPRGRAPSRRAAPCPSWLIF